MKTTLLALLIFISPLVKGQTLQVKEIEKTCERINKELKDRKLKKVFYPQMSFCGALYGYYKDKELVMIEATHSGELGYVSRKCFFSNSELIKMIREDYFPDDGIEWENFCESNKTATGDCDYSKVPFTRIITTVIYSSPEIINRSIDSKDVEIDHPSEVLSDFDSCVKEMKSELEEIKPR